MTMTMTTITTITNNDSDNHNNDSKKMIAKSLKEFEATGLSISSWTHRPNQEREHL